MTTARQALDAAPTTFRTFVRGVPKPKGNLEGFVRGGHAVITERKTGGVKEWQAAVHFVLQDRWTGPPLEGPVRVHLGFCLLKPPSVPKKRHFPTVKPDIDKLARAVLDAMTGIVFRDDAQVVSLLAAKRYEAEGGVQIEVVGER